MNLINFELAQPSYAIELNGLGFVWDLHNSGEFLGLDFNTIENAIVMKWRMAAVLQHNTPAVIYCFQG
jgi:hypothetical protein